MQAAQHLREGVGAPADDAMQQLDGNLAKRVRLARAHAFDRVLTHLLPRLPDATHQPQGVAEHVTRTERSHQLAQELRCPESRRVLGHLGDPAPRRKSNIHQPTTYQRAGARRNQQAEGGA